MTLTKKEIMRDQLILAGFLFIVFGSIMTYGGYKLFSFSEKCKEAGGTVIYSRGGAVCIDAEKIQIKE